MSEQTEKSEKRKFRRIGGLSVAASALFFYLSYNSYVPTTKNIRRYENIEQQIFQINDARGTLNSIVSQAYFSPTPENIFKKIRMESTFDILNEEETNLKKEIEKLAKERDILNWFEHSKNNIYHLFATLGIFATIPAILSFFTKPKK